MKQPTDFSKYLTDFLVRYLPHERGASSNTILSYRDTFMLYLIYSKNKGVDAEKITINHITKDNVLSFLEWLEIERKCSVSTRNLRLAAIHSFFKYLQYQNPVYMCECQKVMIIPDKKTQKPIIGYLTVEQIKMLLQQPDITTPKGYRDLALLSLIYDTACRVSEVINMTPQSVKLYKPHTVIVKGKGGKSRVVPLLEEQLNILKLYMERNNLTQNENMQHPLFANCWGEKLTRAGVSNILNKYVKKARENNILFTKSKISCHSLRHSKAMHLLQAGVHLVYIRDILGHSNIQTTEIYARADSKAKREAIEKAYKKITKDVGTEPIWQGNEKLMEFLKSF